MPSHPFHYQARDLALYPWVVPESKFQDILFWKKNTSPGPDGVPYAAWKSAGDSAQHILYEIYLRMIQTGRLPPDFKVAR
eukprot:2510474-Pyramimonas_sp.AAC.1